MEARTVWVTGAGSGMGRAAALAAARDGRPVALSGRRAQRLEEVAAEIRADGGTALAVPLDVTDRTAVGPAAARIEEELGGIEALVLSAGLNTPHRYWRDQDLRGVRRHHRDQPARAGRRHRRGPARHARSGRRHDRAHLLVRGLALLPHAGTAYSASKAALGPLAAMLNTQENRHGIRACHLCPGDVDSDFLEQRPRVPGAADRAVMLAAEDVGRAVSFVLTSPPHVVIDELVISPAKPQA